MIEKGKFKKNNFKIIKFLKNFVKTPPTIN